MSRRCVRSTPDKFHSMKRTLATILLTLGFASTAALADVAIYKGSAATKATGGGKSLTVVPKITQVIDLESNTMVTISAINVRLLRIKEFRVSPPVSTTKAVVKAKNADTTVFAYADNDSGQVAFGSFIGTNAKKGVKIKADADAVALPVSLKASGTILNAGGDVDQNDLTTVSGVLKLNTASSVKANALTPGVDQTLFQAAVQMVVDELVAAGYEDETPRPE